LKIARKGSRIVVSDFDDPEGGVSRAMLELWPSENEKSSGRANQELREIFKYPATVRLAGKWLET
jgi:hypothetical protein